MRKLLTSTILLATFLLINVALTNITLAGTKRTVTSDLNDGPGTLREMFAFGNPDRVVGGDTIVFAPHVTHINLTAGIQPMHFDAPL